MQHGFRITREKYLFLATFLSFLQKISKIAELLMLPYNQSRQKLKQLKGKNVFNFHSKAEFLSSNKVNSFIVDYFHGEMSNDPCHLRA